MNRIIFLASAILALEGAQAQSSVTIYGVLDATASYGKGATTHLYSAGNSGLNASRLGFRGKEDLGGGLTAGFTLEAGISNDTGLGQSTNTNNSKSGATASGGMTFNRRSTVSVSSSWGELRLGRDYTPQYVSIGAFDPFNNNGVGAPQVLIGALQANAPYGIAAGGSTGPLIRASNSVGYFLPANLGGFYGQAMRYLGESAANDGTGTAFRFGYGGSTFDVAVAASKTKYVVGVVTTTSLGGMYNFGPFRIMGDLQRDSLSGLVTGRGWLLATVIPFSVGDVHASYSDYKVDSGNQPGARKFSIAYTHNLSKRTALYASAAHLKNRGGSAQALNGSIGATDRSSAGADLGIRLFF